MNSENNAVAPGYRALALQFCFVASDENPEGNLSKLMPGWQMVWSSGQPRDPNYFFVAKDTNYTAEDVFVLAIRGSVMPTEDWDTLVDYILEDLNSVLWPWKYGGTAAAISAGGAIAFLEMEKVHNALKNSAPETLLDFLTKNAVGDRKRLIIAGHSLGGNLAKVYASYFMQMLKVSMQGKIHLITFAAPASGNAAFQADLNRKISSQEHCQNLNDIVPFYPTVAGLHAIGTLYMPGPRAANINMSYMDKHTKRMEKMNLQEFFDKLAIDFTIFNYQQPLTGYCTFLASPLLGTADELVDELKYWQLQTVRQHQIAVYAHLLGIDLPKRNTQTPAAEATV